MHINDTNGKRIEVTDLKKAKHQASMFATMKHEDERFSKLDDKLRNYWKDVLNKLNALENK